MHKMLENTLNQLNILNYLLNFNSMCRNFVKLRDLTRFLVRPIIILPMVLLILGVFDASAQQVTVTGTVSDNSGETLAGVTIAVKGTSTGVMSSTDGQYSITAPNQAAVLVFSYVGYEPQEITVGSQTVINVQLKPNTELEEVVVTGLGITKEARAVGYAVSTVKAAELTKAGTPNFASALYGKAAGVRIRSTPGGQTSGVSVTVRGISSMFGNTQPLLVMDGVPIRNGNANVSDDARRSSQWNDSRLQGNGIIDINPEDIESISILKGAAASALYGSEAANGVVLVTSKKSAKGTGTRVDFNATLAANLVAYTPKVQTEYGPGQMRTSMSEYELYSGGFVERSWNNWGTTEAKTYKTVNWGDGSNYYFGPKYDGSPVLYWDGKMRPFEAQSDSPWKDFFRTGFNQNYNIAISHGGEKSNMRFSYTYVDDTPTQYNSDYSKHNFNLTGSVDITKSVKLDYTVNYIRQDVHNRAMENYGMFSSYSGMTGAFDDMALMREKYTVTSLGYRNVVYDASSNNTLTPTESFAFMPRNLSIMNDILWPMLGRNFYEKNQRFISSVAPTWTITDYLTLRGRLSTDLTTEAHERKESTERPLSIDPNNPGGAYNIINKNYEIYYGDIMLMFNRDITEKINLSASLGFQGRVEETRSTKIKTRDGLSVDNWFHINASRNSQLETGMEYTDLLRTAYFGSVGVSYNNFLYLEATGRQETTSTLPQKNNSYFYPSVNASYIFSEHLKEALPWYDYGKLRVSYGIVGNAPDVYKANVVYNPENKDGYLFSTIPGDYGNENLKAEIKHEFEIGLESRFFKNRAGIELSYYNNRVTDQLILYDVPRTSGVERIWQNMGELKNYGVEATLNVTPVQTKDWQWDLRLNYAMNRNEVTKLPDVLPYLDNRAGIGNVGSASNVRSYVGRSAGEIFLHDRKMVNGMRVVTSDGYQVDSEWKSYGFLLPDAVGGVSSSLSYKNIALDFMFDFNIGGKVLETWHTYATAFGITEKSLQYRDPDRGGEAYYFDGANTLANVKEGVNPNGGPTFYDGVRLKGVQPDDNGSITDATGAKYSEVSKVVPSSNYYQSMYNAWGSGSFAEDLFDNSYLKCREISLTYRLPVSLTKKFGCNNLNISLFGRNLFYVFKNLQDFDAESSISTSWTGAGDIGATTAATRSIGISIRASF
jgi:TonB-linked SusC/RagA family outer membrane protein